MKYIPLFEDFKNLNEKVTVDTSRYERSHGKKPRGRGAWAFYFDRTGGEALFTPHSMSYADAVKWAKEQAKKAGKTVIYVGESVNESRVKPFKKVKVGDIATDYNGDTWRVIAVGKVKNLMRYDDSGAAEELDPNEEAIALDGMGGTAVFSYDLDGAVVYESLNESLNEGFTSFADLEIAIRHHEDGNPYYDMTKLINIYNGLKSSDQIKAKKKYSNIFGVKESEVNESKKLTSSQLSNFLLDLIYTAAQYTSEDLESLAGQIPRDLDDAIRMVLDYIPSSKKRKFIDDAEKMIQLKKLDESRRIIHPVIMQQRYLHAKSKKLVLPNISDIDHTRIVKWMGDNYYSNQYDIMMKGKDLEIVFKKMSSQEIERLKDYLKSQNYLKESNNIDVTQLKVGRILHFKDGEEWKITKIIGNPKNPRGVLALPHGDTKKNYVSVAIEFSIDDLENSLSNIFPGK